MKKYCLIILILMICCVCNAQNACQNAYVSALQKYKNGNYVEAQRELVNVAQTCGNYSDVWKILKDCNKKLSDRQTQQADEIKQLKDEIQRLTSQNKKLESEKTQLENDKSTAAVQVQKSKKTIEKLQQDIDILQKDTSALQTQIRRLNDTIFLLLCNEVASNADAQGSTQKIMQEVADSVANVGEGITNLQNAINQLNENYKKQATQSEVQSLSKNPINDLQDAVEKLNATLTKVLKQIKKVRP